MSRIATGGAVFMFVLSVLILAALGYGAQKTVVDAWGFPVPHSAQTVIGKTATFFNCEASTTNDWSTKKVSHSELIQSAQTEVAAEDPPIFTQVNGWIKGPSGYWWVSGDHRCEIRIQ